jgi:WD40 repeat protein
MKSGIAGDSGAELRPIRIFVCSSGDMIAERQAALRVIEAINRAAHGEARLEPYLWEENTHRFQGAQSYQGNIPLPAEFDIFLGFLFSRIGSRLTEEEYRRDILAKLSRLAAGRSHDRTASPDLMALTQLSAELPAEALPTGTTFEIINARDMAQRPGGDGRPCLWLAVNGAIPDGLTSRERNIAEPVRQRWDEVSRFVEDELNARHVPVVNYGTGVPRAQQLTPGGLQGFEDELEKWLTNTLVTQFGLRLSWAERAYVGLRPFTPEEAPIFLGRRSSIAEALGRLDQLAREGPCPMLLLTGPSGAGKSSFARAGLIGHLGAYRLHRRRAEGALFVAELVRTWRHLAVRPAELGDDPAGELLARLGAVLGAVDGFASLARNLAGLSFEGAEDLVPLALAERLRAAVQRRLAEAGPAPALFILLDQLEDLLASDRTPAARRLLALLQVLSDSPERSIWVVVAIADQWRATLGSAELAAVLEAVPRFALSPPREAELREIIEVPARRAGRVFEQGPGGKSLDQEILDDLNKLSLFAEAPLPLLQVALAQLEDRKNGANRLTFAAYREMGGVAGAIRSHARAALAEWQTPERQPVLDRLLFHLVQRDPQQRIICRLAPRREIEADAEMRALEEHLVAPEWRLLQGHNDQGTEGAIRIAHDVLLDHAEAFARFRENERDNVILLADARDTAARWATEGRPAALLNHHLSSVERLQTLLTRLGMPADDELAVFIAASGQEIGRLQRERDAAFLTRSRFLAGFARQQNEVSDFGTALALGLEAIPDPGAGIGNVVAAEAVFELDRAVRLVRERYVLRGHENWVKSAVFDPFGARVLTASWDHTARLWDAATGAEIEVLRGHENWVESAVFDPFGARVLTASWDHTARLWDAASGTELTVLRGHKREVLSALFDSSGTRVLTTSHDHTARLWDAATGAEQAVLSGHDDAVLSAVFDPSGAHVVTASIDNTARLWDSATGAELAVLRGHENRVESAVFDPSGRRVLTASYDHTARLWDRATGTELAVLRGHESSLLSAVFDPSGAWVLTASADRTARLWDAASGTELTVLRGHQHTVLSAVFDPSGTRVLTRSYDNTARLWDAVSGAELAVLRGHQGSVSSAVFDPSSGRMLTGSTDHTARLWGPATSDERGLLLGHEDAVSIAVFDPSGGRVLTASNDRTARLWDAASGAERAVLRGHADAVWSAVFDPSGARVLTASADRTARLWDAASGAELARLRGHADAVLSAVFDPKGARVLTASNDRTARLWDAATGAELAVLRGHADTVWYAVFDPSGGRVLTASGDHTARLWDAASGGRVAVLRGHESAVESAVFDPSGECVLTGSRDHTARLWEAASGAELAVLRGHESGVEGVVFDPAGARVLTASSDHTARLWDVATGAELAVLRHANWVQSAVFDPSGTRVLTASSDNTARLWDAATGAELAVLRGHADTVWGAMFDPSAARALTASGDHTARIWRVFPTVVALVEYSRAVMPRPLSPTQRKQFFLE